MWPVSVTDGTVSSTAVTSAIPRLCSLSCGDFLGALSQIVCNRKKSVSKLVNLTWVAYYLLLPFFFNPMIKKCCTLLRIPK